MALFSLTRKAVAASVTVHAEGYVAEVATGTNVKFETSPGGAEWLDEVIPPGKKWENVSITLRAKEVDA
jgi:hypothetical protein